MMTRYQLTLDYLVGSLLGYIYREMDLSATDRLVDIALVHGFFEDALQRQGFSPETVPELSFDDAYEWDGRTLRAREVPRHPLELLPPEDLLREIFPDRMLAQVYLEMMDFQASAETDKKTRSRMGTYLAERAYRMTPIDAVRIRVIRMMIGLT